MWCGFMGSTGYRRKPRKSIRSVMTAGGVDGETQQKCGLALGPKDATNRRSICLKTDGLSRVQFPALPLMINSGVDAH